MSIMKELWDNLGYGGFSLSAQNLRDHAAKAERNLASTSSDDVSASAVVESVGVPMQPEPESSSDNSLNRNTDKCLELDLHISVDWTDVLHMKDQEQVVQSPQRQAPIGGLITSKMSEQLNQPAISGNNNEAAVPGKLLEYKHPLFLPSVERL